MYSYLQRANAAFAFALSVSFAVFGLVALSSPLVLSRLPPINPSFSVTNAAVKQGRIVYYDPNSDIIQQGKISFNLNADLRPLFNWNTKQLFISIVAEHSTKTHSSNQMSIYDDIIVSKDAALINLKRQKAEYQITDLSDNIQKLTTNFSLHWNVVPHVGLFLWKNEGSVAFTMPLMAKAS